jgi:acetyl esterase/lipase
MTMRAVALLALLLTLPIFVAGQGDGSIQREIEYGRVGEHRLFLDLYLPGSVDKVKTPLVIWVHGGAWRSGSKEKMPLDWLVKDHGYAIASVDYRLSPVAAFPAQIHDLKAAVRFLRAKAGDYAYAPDKIAIAGSSAGGHLVALMGVTNGHQELEGKIGEHLEQSSDVQAVVDYYGPTNFMTILQQSTVHGLGVRVPALQLLLRGQPEDKTDLANLASPVFHVDATDPPLLMIHGDQDIQVPINQSHELEGKYQARDLDVAFEVVHGGGHGGELFFDKRRRKLVEDFLSRALVKQAK